MLENWIWLIEPTKEPTRIIYFSAGTSNRIGEMIRVMEEKYGVILTDDWDGIFPKQSTNDAGQKT